MHTRVRLMDVRMIDFEEENLIPTITGLKKYINRVLNIPNQTQIFSYRCKELKTGNLASNIIKWGSIINIAIQSINLKIDDDEL
jgi:hypothetical protein